MKNLDTQQYNLALKGCLEKTPRPPLYIPYVTHELPVRLTIKRCSDADACIELVKKKNNQLTVLDTKCPCLDVLL